MVPSTTRYTIEDLGDSLKITVPSSKHWLQVFFFCAMFVPWIILGIGGGAMLGILLNPPPSGIASHAQNTANFWSTAFIALFLLAFLSVWLMTGTIQLYTILWRLAGREVIHVAYKSIRLCRQVFGLGRPQEYLIDNLSNLRISPIKNSRWNIESLWRTDGSIAFDYGAEVCHFGSELTEADATHIVDTIKQKFPQYRIKRQVKIHPAQPKHVASIWLVLVATTFLAGGISRTLQQATGAGWLEGVVGIFMGLGWIVMSLPLLFIKRLTAHKTAALPILSTVIIGCAGLAGLFITLGGIYLILLGVQALSVVLR
jgi:hypothetical protein